MSGEKFNMSDEEFAKSNSSVERNNVSEGTLPPFQLASYITNYFLTGVCMIIVFCDIIAVRILRRCKRVPYQCLQLSISYLLSDIVGMIIYIIHTLLIFGFDVHTDSVLNSRISTVALMNCISSASMAAIILERVFAMKANLRYTLALKRVNIYFIIAVIWLAHILVTSCIVSVSLYFHCNWRLSNCDITEVNKAPKYYFLALTILYDVIMVFANAIIYKVARRHAIRIDEVKQVKCKDKMKYPDSVSERQYASIMLFTKNVTCYLLLQIPLFVTMVVSTQYPDLRDETPVRIFRFSYKLICKLVFIYFENSRMQNAFVFHDRKVF